MAKVVQDQKVVQDGIVRIHHQHPSIRRCGIAVAYYPHYVHRKRELHSVDVVLLSVILRGRGVHLLGDEVHRITQSTIGITHYGQKHDIITDARGMDVYNVYLDLRNHTLPVVPERLRATLSAILPIHPRLLHQINRRISIRIDEPEKFLATLRRIEQETRGDAPGALEIVQHSFQVFLIDLCRAAQRHGYTLSDARRSHFPGWIEQLRQDIDDDFTAPWDLATIASEARVSVAYVCRLFKAYTGKTVVHYVIERRIQAAIWKLREGDEKITAIAFACGFNDVAYFNRAFKRIVGKTPSAYRKAMVGKA